MNRRNFLTSAFAATAGGLLVPEWLLDPPKGRSMVAVPQVKRDVVKLSVPSDVEVFRVYHKGKLVDFEIHHSDRQHISVLDRCDTALAKREWIDGSFLAPDYYVICL